MAQIQTLIEFTFTSLLLIMAGLAFTAYAIAFYAVMIALDGCEICKWMCNSRTQSLWDKRTHGHALSRT